MTTFGAARLGAGVNARRSALLLLAACIKSRQASLLALTAFGWYYACDAAFYRINGFIGRKPLMSNVMLNLPH